MGELIFVGLGLYDEKDLSLRALEEIKTADKVFVELYTSLMPGLEITRLETLLGKRVTVMFRKNLEEERGQQILQEAKKAKVAFLVPGDPMIATTHVDLRIRANRMGVRTRIVHGASIISAVVGLTGLQNYKFGRSVTVPFAEDGVKTDTPYNVITENKKRGLHTLCFLDIKAEEKRCMTVKDGLTILLAIEKEKRKKVVSVDTLVVGVARAGAPDCQIKAGYVKGMLNHDFGNPPHTLVFPGQLHFVEAEALVALADAPKKVLEKI
ncbi:MAG TPA: diphthine synthase [Candidatus Krumholzibacteriaceae bacterium]|nr:diphthine synthase [Candidatus Krumholzibacteriaceae bacterium]